MQPSYHLTDSFTSIKTASWDTPPAATHRCAQRRWTYHQHRLIPMAAQPTMRTLSTNTRYRGRTPEPSPPHIRLSPNDCLYPATLTPPTSDATAKSQWRGAAHRNSWDRPLQPAFITQPHSYGERMLMTLLAAVLERLTEERYMATRDVTRYL